MKLPTIKINIANLLLKITTLKGRYEINKTYLKLRKFLNI